MAKGNACDDDNRGKHDHVSLLVVNGLSRAASNVILAGDFRGVKKNLHEMFLSHFKYAFIATPCSTAIPYNLVGHWDIPAEPPMPSRRCSYFEIAAVPQADTAHSRLLWRSSLIPKFGNAVQPNSHCPLTLEVQLDSNFWKCDPRKSFAGLLCTPGQTRIFPMTARPFFIPPLIEADPTCENSC